MAALKQLPCIPPARGTECSDLFCALPHRGGGHNHRNGDRIAMNHPQFQ